MSLLRESSVYVASSCVVNAGAFLLIPVLTRILSPAEYGILGGIGVFAALLSIVMPLGLHGAVARFYYDYRERHGELRCYVSTIVMTVLAVNVILVAALMLAGPVVFAMLLPRQNFPFFPYGAVVLITGLFTVLGLVPLTLFRVRKQPGRYALAEIGRFVVASTVTLYLVIVLKQGVLGRLAGDLVAGGLVGLALVLSLLATGDLAWRFDVEKVRASLAFGLPLIPHLLLQFLIGMVDRLVIGRFRSLEDLGVFTVAASLASVMNVVVMSVNSAAGPWLFNVASTLSDSRRLIAQTATKYVAALGVVCLCGVLFSREIVMVLLPPTYRSVWALVPILIVGYFFQGLYYFLANVLFYAKTTGRLVVISGIAAVIAVAGNLLLVPSFGVYGAAAAFLISNVCYCALTFASVRRVYRVDYEFGRVAVLVGIIALALCNVFIEQPTAHALFGAAFIVGVGVAGLGAAVGRTWFSGPSIAPMRGGRD